MLFSLETQLHNHCPGPDSNDVINDNVQSELFEEKPQKWPKTMTQGMFIFDANKIDKLKMKRHKRNYSKGHGEPEYISNNNKNNKNSNNAAASAITDVFNASKTANRVKFLNDIDIDKFRNNLYGKNLIPELQRFLNSMKTDSSVIGKFIESDAQPLELAKSLERVSKTNLAHISYICQALEALLSEIATHYPEHRESAKGACNYFLSIHPNVIKSLLSSKEMSHRRIALKLLTAIIAVHPHANGRVLAACTYLLSDLVKINAILSNDKSEKNSIETVRMCYVQFILAFITDKSLSLIQNLTNHPALIQALLYDLVHDDHKSVCLVLEKLKKHLLQNASISKSKKIKIFDVECCKRLFLLYDWLGPHFSPILNIWSPHNTRANEMVANIAHDFLLTLLTSSDFGIAFTVSSNVRENLNNYVQGNVIQFLPKPWCCRRKTELILKIFETCPDLAKHIMRCFSEIIEPRNMSDKEFVDVANFLMNLIALLRPDNLSNTLKRITLSDFSNWITDMCLPSKTLDALRNSNMLFHSNIKCRLASHTLLLTMFNQFTKFMAYAIQRERTKNGQTNVRHFKFDLYNHVLIYFPSLNDILKSLELLTSEDFCADANAVLKHINVSLELILNICRRKCAFLNRTGIEGRAEILIKLHPCYDGEYDDDNKKSILHGYCDIELEIKIVETILLLNPKALQPQRKIFVHIMKSFIEGFMHGNDCVQRQSGNLLREIFKNTGVFDKLSLEIDLWLEALRYFEFITVEILTKALAKVLGICQDKTKHHQQAARLETNKYISLAKLLPLIFKSVQISIPPDKYLDLVCLLLFHYHPTPAYIARMYEMKFKTLPKYMRSWMSLSSYDVQSKSLQLPKVAERIPYLKELHVALLYGYENKTFQEIFGTYADDVSSFEFEVERNKLKLQKVIRNERLLMIYIQEVIFLVGEFLKKHQLKRKQAEFGAKCVINFLALIREIEKQNNTINNNMCSEDENDYDDDDDDADDGGDDVVAVARVKDNFYQRILTYMYEIRFSFLGNNEIFNPRISKNSPFLHFVALISEYCCKAPEFLSFVKKFRLQVFKTVALKIQSVEQIHAHTNSDFIRILEALQMDFTICTELFDMIHNSLNFNDFFNETEFGPLPNFYYELLICILKRFAKLQKPIDFEIYVKPIAKYYAHFAKYVGNRLSLDDFEKAFYQIICQTHQYIQRLDSTIFTCMFEKRKFSKYSVKLARLLLEFNNTFDGYFTSYLPYNVAKREFIVPLLDVAFKKKISIDLKLLKRIYQHNRRGLLQAIENPRKADTIYKENIDCSKALIMLCMPASECISFCEKKFELNGGVCDLFQLQLIHMIYEKAWNSIISNNVNDYSKLFATYISLQLDFLSNDIERSSLKEEKLKLYISQLSDWLMKKQKFPNFTNAESLEIIFRDQRWLNFCNSCVEISMKNDRHSETIDNVRGLLLKLIALFCDKFYMDYKNDKIKQVQQTQNDLNELFRMICKHRNYFDIVMLSNPTKVKTSLLEVIFVLTKKNPTMALSHLQVPVILSAFQGKQSESDRFIFALLNLLELYCPEELQQYRSFIWHLHSLHLHLPKRQLK